MQVIVLSSVSDQNIKYRVGLVRQAEGFCHMVNFSYLIRLLCYDKLTAAELFT